MVTDTHFLFLHAKGLQPVDTVFLPVCEPLKVCIWLTEELHFHLLEFPDTENEIAGCDLVTEGLAYLTDTERNLLSGRSLYILEVYKNTLCCFRTEIYGILRILGNTLEGLEHQVKLSDIGEIVLATARAGDLVLFNEILHLLLCPAIYC